MPITLQHVVAEQLERAPLLMQQLLDAAGGASPALRTTLAAHRDGVAAEFAAALREQLGERGAAASAAAPPGELALVDDAAVAADVAVSRVIEAIESEAEYELREFAAYVAALVGDVAISRPSNPLGAAVYARALWAALQTLPLPPERHVALTTELAAPFARLLRTAYAAASTRLDDAGIEPAAYRTVILPPGARRARGPSTASLERLRDSLMAPLDEPAPRRASSDAAASQPSAAAGPSVDRSSIELLTRLFGALLRDARLVPAAQWLLSRLQASALRVVLDDASLLDDERHAVWRFVDRLAFDAELLGSDGDAAWHWARHAERLVDDMVHSARQDAALYRWGLERLDAHARWLTQQRTNDARAAIDAARDAEARLHAGDPGTPTSAPAVLDVAALDTVPADLLARHDGDDAAARQVDAARWLDARREGELLTLFLHRRWRAVQLLARAPLGDVWLLHEVPSGALHAVRRSALQRLRFEGLAAPCEPRPLLPDAAQAVLRDIEAGDGI